MSLFGNQNTFLKSAEKNGNSRVGKDVKAYCSRCKLNLSHTIITVSSENRPDRVQCNTCRSERTYRPPRNEIEAKSTGGTGMADRDEEFDLDQMDVSKVLLGTDGAKKKAKPKAKPKKAKEESESRTATKAGNTLPLSMQRGTAEDLAHFEAKMLQQKNNIANAKEYKATFRFKPGEIVSHKTFGTGFVVAENGLNKIEVLFREGRKLLVTAPKG
jgi:hypothetical protein